MINTVGIGKGVEENNNMDYDRIKRMMKFVVWRVNNGLREDVINELWLHIIKNNLVDVSDNYLFLVLRNKCIDILRKHSTNRKKFVSLDFEIEFLDYDLYNIASSNIPELLHIVSLIIDQSGRKVKQFISLVLLEILSGEIHPVKKAQKKSGNVCPSCKSYINILDITFTNGNVKYKCSNCEWSGYEKKLIKYKMTNAKLYKMLRGIRDNYDRLKKQRRVYEVRSLREIEEQLYKW